MPRSSLLVAALVAGLAPAASARADNALHGRLEVTGLGALARAGSVDAVLGARSRGDLHSDIRLTWAPHWGHWDVNLHYVLRGAAGRGVALARDTAAALPAAPPPPCST